MPLLRCLAYLWASPNTAIGLLFLPLSLPSGGRARVVSGVLEVHGPGIAWALERGVPLAGGATAMTLGHVVIGRSSAALEQSRLHERVHVRQYERWGPFFIPAYLVSSLVSLLRGRRPYRDNIFEREAYAHGGRSRDQSLQ